VVTFDQDSSATPRRKSTRQVLHTPATTPAASVVANGNSGMWPPTPVPFTLDAEPDSSTPFVSDSNDGLNTEDTLASEPENPHESEGVVQVDASKAEVGF
jgi:hypothetical protein